MAEQLIISVSGMRGLVGENLTDSVAHDYGCAFGTFLKNSCAGKAEKLSVCIGRDSRSSGPMLKSAVASGLCDTGLDVVDLAIAPTPSVGVMVKQLDCSGGVVITASHNPIQYNGIKLLLANSIAPPPEEAEQIRRLFLDRKFSLADSHNRGKLTSNEQTDKVHISKVLSIVDKGMIAAKRFRVVLDSVNGAGGRVTRKLLTELGCKVVAINDEPTGVFAHVPEPTAKNLTRC
jgi:phosphomannomutase